VIEAVLRGLAEYRAPCLVVAEVAPPAAGFLEELSARVPEVRSETLEAFRAALDRPSTLRAELFERPGEVRLVPQAEIHALFAEPADGWEAFRARFPESTAFWRFSPVGISADGAEALVYVEWAAGPLIAWGQYVRLVREAGSWIVAERRLAWIS
jgi:hypothetical protein